MTVGIYKLVFNNTDKVYIGQSINIQRRFTAHLRLLRLGLASEKLQYAYNTFGEPCLHILCECSKDDLSVFESEAIDIYNSVLNGFNTLQSYSGIYTSQVGEEASNSKYTNNTYIEIFHLCVEDNLDRKEIAELLGVSLPVVVSIDKLENHKWIHALFPKETKILLDRKNGYNPKTANNAASQGIVYPKLLSPEGELYEVTHLREFARKHNMFSSNLERLLHGGIKSLKGWVVEGTKLPSYSKLVSPEGKLFEIKYGEASIFAKTHSLSPGNLSMLLSGKKSKYKGWTIVPNIDE